MSEQMGGSSMGEVTSDDKLWALLSYVFSPLTPVIIILFLPDKKDRPFIKSHNMQALILGIVTVVTSGICIGILIWLYQVYCGIQAYSGKPVVIPVITDFVKNQ
ncbi:MAG: hypothetical protein HYZ49_06485, partial [Chloroflexi bacterium]|nr:hypothetical protein [Chloroflexota bacterium]